MENNSANSLAKIKKKMSSSGVKFVEQFGIDTVYKYTKNKDDNREGLPEEMLILMRKFNTIKVLRLIISNYNNINNEDVGESYTNNSSNGSLEIDQNDLHNDIFVLLNIKWLFPRLAESEIDF